MTTEANTVPVSVATTPDEPSDDAYAQAGELLVKEFFPEKAAPEPEPEGESAAPESNEVKAEEKPEEAEKPEGEVKPAKLFAMARKKVKQAEQYESKVTAFAEQVQNVATNVKQQERMISGVIDGIKEDPVKAFDEICRIAGIDSVTGFERLARAKIQARAGKPADEPEKRENLELETLRRELAELKEGLTQRERQREQQNGQESLQNAKGRDHYETFKIIQESDAFDYAKGLDEDELHEAIKVFVNNRYTDQATYRVSTPARMARAVEEYAREQFEKAQRMAAKRAAPPAKPPPVGRAAPALSNKDAAEAHTRERTEIEAFEEAGAEVLKMFGL